MPNFMRYQVDEPFSSAGSHTLIFRPQKHLSAELILSAESSGMVSKSPTMLESMLESRSWSKSWGWEGWGQGSSCIPP